MNKILVTGSHIVVHYYINSSDDRFNSNDILVLRKVRKYTVECVKRSETK